VPAVRSPHDERIIVGVRAEDSRQADRSGSDPIGGVEMCAESRGLPRALRRASEQSRHVHRTSEQATMHDCEWRPRASQVCLPRGVVLIPAPTLACIQPVPVLVFSLLSLTSSLSTVPSTRVPDAATALLLVGRDRPKAPHTTTPPHTRMHAASSGSLTHSLHARASTCNWRVDQLNWRCERDDGMHVQYLRRENSQFRRTMPHDTIR
jgi:hypothetical protein